MIGRLAALPGSDRLFNPYADGDSGGAIRRANLSRYLADMLWRRPRILMLFEAPGYRGCALSGIPVTSERIMLRGMATWGLFGVGYHASSGQPEGVAEMTATILWDALQQYADRPPLIWNAVPLHPHRPGQRQSNRAPTAAERHMGLPYLEEILRLFDLEIVLAVGRTAQKSLAKLGQAASPIRHPAQGGKADFTRGLRETYRR